MSWSAVTGGKSASVTASSAAATVGAAISVGDLIVVNGQRGSASLGDLGADRCTDSLGNSYKQIVTGWDSGNTQGFSCFYSIATFPGTPTITVTYLTSHSFSSTVAEVYRESGGFVSLEQTLLGPTPGTAVAGVCTVGSVQPYLDNELIVGLLNDTSSAGVFTAGSGMTLDQTTAFAGGNAAIESLFQGTSASFSVTGVDSVATPKFLSAALVFAPVAALPPLFIPHRMPLGV